MPCNTKGVESKAKIGLSFKVSTHFAETFDFGWTDNSARVVYVELRGR